MALGALDSMGRGVLERSYRDVVAALDGRNRLLLVAEEGEEILGMAQLVFSGATNVPRTSSAPSGSSYRSVRCARNR